MIEEKINFIENNLSFYCVKPIFKVGKKVEDCLGKTYGTLPGFVLGLGVAWVVGIPLGMSKAVLGVAQTTSALALVILMTMPALLQNEGSKNLFFRACKHIPHGIGNIIAGIFEATPLVGSICVAIRFIRAANAAGSGTTLNEYQLMEHPKFKFYAYQHNTVENSAYWKKQFADYQSGKEI